MNDSHELAGVDLNLLVALDCLTETRSVTRAAERLGVTQSAMSHTLRRLRALFDDPLMVRVGAGMALTPRAEALVVPVRAALRTLGRVLVEPEDFDPGSAVRTFRICAPDLFETLLLPRLWAQLSAAAPGVDLVVVPAPLDRDRALATGELDVAIVPVQGDEPARGGAESLRRTLFRDEMRCFLRRGHPLAAELDLDGFCVAGHVMVSPSGRGPGVVDRVLARVGRERRVAVRVPSFASALSVVGGSDLVLTGPSSLERVCGAGIVAADAPVPVPGHGVAMVWHRRFGGERGHTWFRGQLLELVA